MDELTRPDGAPGDHHPDLDSDLGWSLGVLLRAYQSALGGALGDLPHGYRGYQVLREVVRGDQPSQLALAAHLGIDRTVMTYLVDDMVSAGLVERRLNEADRRQRRVVATDGGAQRLTELERRVEAAEGHVLAALSPVESVLLGALVRRAACASRDLGAERDPCEVVDEMVARVAGGERG